MSLITHSIRCCLQYIESLDLLKTFHLRSRRDPEGQRLHQLDVVPVIADDPGHVAFADGVDLI